MFTIKNAIMEVLNKNKSLSDVLNTLQTNERQIFIAAFELMKAKLSGVVDLMKTYDNGQWQIMVNKSNTLQDNTPMLNYKEINSPANQPQSRVKPGPTLDYSKFTSPKPSDIKERKDKALKENQEWQDKGSYGSGVPKNAVKKDEDSDIIEAIKAKYKEPPIKSDDDKISEIKDQYRKQNKAKAEKPIKVNTALAKPK